MKKPLLILATCFVAVNIYAQTWTQIDSLPGTPRYGATSFVIDSFAYIAGGYNSGISLGSFYKFNPVSSIWSQLASLPDSTEGAAGFAVNRKGYLVSGTSGSGYYQSVYQYDPVANAWNTMNDFPGDGRQDAIAFATDGLGYLFGGHAGGGVVNDLWEYNPANDTWTQLSSMPADPRSGPSGFLLNATIYVGLGGNDDGSAMYQDMYGYNIAADTWDTIATFPGHARRGAVGFSYNNEYGIIGLGIYHSESTGLDTLYNDLYLYNPVNNGWSRYIPFQGSARSGANCFTFGDVAYVGCGITDSFAQKDWWQLANVDAGLTAVKADNKISVYPDPATDIIRFDMEQAAGVSGILQIFDGLGQRVRNIQLNGLQSTQVDVNDLTCGLYIYQLSDNGRVNASGKFAVVH